MAKKKEILKISEIVSQLSVFATRPNAFSGNVEIVEELIRLQGKAIALQRSEASIKRDIAELDLNNEEGWEEILERRNDFSLRLSDLAKSIQAFASKIGM